MRRLPALTLLVFFALLAVASPVRATCTPHASSDGGSMCLPEDWRLMDWDDLAEDLEEPAIPGLHTQMVLIAGKKSADGQILSVMVNRLGVSDSQGRLVPAAAVQLVQFVEGTAAQYGRDKLVLAPVQARIGGREFWRMVIRGPMEGALTSILSIMVNDAFYQLWISTSASDASGLPQQEALIVSGWKPGNAPMRMPQFAAHQPTQPSAPPSPQYPALPVDGWRTVSSPLLPKIRMAMPAAWEEEPGAGETQRDVKDGLHTILATVLMANDPARANGSAAMHVQSLWVQGSDGAVVAAPDPGYFTDARAAMVAGMEKKHGLALLDTAQETVGLLTVSQRFYRQEKSYNGRPGGLILGFISGPGRLIAAMLMYERLGDPAWRGLLPAMFRRWEFSPSELKALGAQTPRS